MQFQRRFEKEGHIRKFYQHSPSNVSQKVSIDAQHYMLMFHQEHGDFHGYMQRLDEVRTEIEHAGTYWQTPEELSYGAMMAWRNNTRCIGRLTLQMLQVRDMRYLSTAQDIFTEIVEHIRLATNSGKIQSMITIFAPQYPGHSGIR